MEINFTTQIWKEGKMYVSYCPELNVSSCGKTIEKARKNLLEAVEIFLEETSKMGTLKEILREAGFVKDNKKKWKAPELITLERTALSFRYG